MICPHCGKAVSTRVTGEQRAQVLKLHDEGYSLRDIQGLTGVSFSNAGRIIRNRKDGSKKRD